MLLKVFALLKWLLIITFSLVLMIALFIKFAPTFGGQPDAISQEKINNSPNFDGKVFKNLITTQASTINIESITSNEPESKSGADKSKSNNDDNQYKSEDASGGFLKNIIFPPIGKNPKLVETVELDLNSQPLQDGEFVWLGHSSVLFKIAGKTIITDPVFNPASPISLFVRPFNMTNTPTVDDLPFVDAVFISHDHYDHLDYKAIQQMQEKVGHFYVPLGIKAHLQQWGVTDDKITELDWYEESVIKGNVVAENNTTDGNEPVQPSMDIQVVLTPARHFSGRGINNHRTTLWGSWVIKSLDLSVYFSGDGGYSPEFAKIGEKYGDFDIAFIEDGAYNARWQDVHMLPEQSAQAGIDVGAKVVLPIHWGKFDLSTHEWREPVRRIKTAMDKHNANVDTDKQVSITTPRIGQRFNLGNTPTDTWWK